MNAKTIFNIFGAELRTPLSRVIFVLFIALSIVLCIISCQPLFSCKKYQEELYKEGLSGVIFDIEDEQNCFARLSVQTLNEVKNISVCYCGYNKDFWNLISIGDSISLISDGDSILLIKKDVSLKFIFPCCDW